MGTRTEADKRPGDASGGRPERERARCRGEATKIYAEPTYVEVSFTQSKQDPAAPLRARFAQQHGRPRSSDLLNQAAHVRSPINNVHLVTTPEGFQPGVDPHGHENEMGHTVDHREDYTQTYGHLFGSRCPFVVMAWGESLHYGK